MYQQEPHSIPAIEQTFCLFASLFAAVAELDQVILRVALIAGMIAALRLFRPGRALPTFRVFLFEPLIASAGAVMISTGVIWWRPEWPMAAHICLAIAAGWLGMKVFDFVEQFAEAKARKLLEKEDEEKRD